MATEREIKARRICAKLQLRAYRRKWKPKERVLWDKIIMVIKRERQK